MPYRYNIIYLAGKLNTAADALSRANYLCSNSLLDELYELYSNLCHPGTTRMLHFIRSRNLPYSVEDVRRITSDCSICRKVKPRYVVTRPATIIKALRPLDRISLDFKGPLVSQSQNKFLLVIVDEYSRFPFAYPCKDISAGTIKSCLADLFSIFGLPSYVHSDRGTAFMSAELRSFLSSNDIAISRTTPYHPEGN